MNKIFGFGDDHLRIPKSQKIVLEDGRVILIQVWEPHWEHGNFTSVTVKGTLMGPKRVMAKVTAAEAKVNRADVKKIRSVIPKIKNAGAKKLLKKAAQNVAAGKK